MINVDTASVAESSSVPDSHRMRQESCACADEQSRFTPNVS